MLLFLAISGKFLSTFLFDGNSFVISWNHECGEKHFQAVLTQKVKTIFWILVTGLPKISKNGSKNRELEIFGRELRDLGHKK